MLGIRRIVGLVLVAASLTLVPAGPADAKVSAGSRAVEITTSVVGSISRRLPFTATHVAVYWVGQRDAHVTVAFRHGDGRLGRAVDAGRDEIGTARANGITYGAVLVTRGATAVRVTSDRRIRRLTVLAIADRVTNIVSGLLPDKAHPTTQRPPIIDRASWGADESLRFAENGTETWPPTFAPIQKLLVHHTATANNDPNPAATVRAIYRYHAITQGWGDIGYNFLIDESGRIYKGRNSHAPGSSTDTLAGEDEAGRGVTAAHAHSYNAGAVGIALLGTLTSQDATPAAKRALEELLAWKADRHNIDPRGSSAYTNSTGKQSVFPNIAGHRDVAPTTECPGGTFYTQLPAIRNDVAVRVSTA